MMCRRAGDRGGLLVTLAPGPAGRQRGGTQLRCSHSGTGGLPGRGWFPGLCMAPMDWSSGRPGETPPPSLTDCVGQM